MKLIAVALAYFALVSMTKKKDYQIEPRYQSLSLKARRCLFPGNAKVGSISVPLTSCLAGLESAV
jgi:hypothetical protein